MSRPFTNHLRRRFTYRPPGRGAKATVQRGINATHVPAYVAKETGENAS